MRKLLVVAAASLMTVCGVVLLVPSLAAAKTGEPTVSVIQISGLLDRVQADFWKKAMRDADAAGDLAIVVQLDSNRSVLSDDRLDELEDAVAEAKTPVAIWVGPAKTGSVGGDVVYLLAAADVFGVAPGADVDAPQGTSFEVNGAVTDRLDSPTLGDFIVDLDGQAGIEIPLKSIDGGQRRQPLVEVSFSKPSLTARTVHGVTSPGPAYALLILGLLLAVLEFATAGVGLAALTSAILLGLAALGLGGLPVNGPALAALVFAVFGFSIDLQAGAPRAWTAIGTGAMLFGSLSLYQDGMSVPIVWIVGVFGLTAAFVLTGLPSLIRARFSSPTIGREGFVGEVGAAAGVLHPEGFVTVRGATWRARTNRATPIEDGAAIRVVGLDGLVLDVEPEEGGAKDYRERSNSRK